MADNVIVRVPEQQFIRGEDGYSPEVTIENIEHGHSVTITDRDHPTGQSFNVMDGDSAYEQAVAGGYTGTEAQFNEELASFKELSDEMKEVAPFYAEYGVTTKAEIEAAINNKRQIYLNRGGGLGGVVAPYTGTFLYADIWGEGTGYRFARTNGNWQYVYELKSEWTYSIYDLTAPAQRAEAAAAQALVRMNSADASAQEAEESAGDASTAATTATTKAGEATASATAADGSAKDSEAYAVGKRGGTDVGSTDPAYHNNAKYYAEQASGSATAASGSATSAASSATAAGNAQTAAETAQAAAEDAQEAAEAVLASIPADYTELTEDVDDLKSAVDAVSMFEEYLPEKFEDTRFNRKVTICKNKITIEKTGSNSTTFCNYSLFGHKFLGTGSSVPTSQLTDEDFISFTPYSDAFILQRFTTFVSSNAATVYYLVTKNPDTNEIKSVTALNSGLGTSRTANMFGLLPDIVSNGNFGIVFTSRDNTHNITENFWIKTTVRPVLASITNNVLATYKANKAYAVGDVLFAAGTLYRVTAAIANGAQLIPDTNIVRTTVEELIKLSNS